MATFQMSIGKGPLGDPGPGVYLLASKSPSESNVKSAQASARRIEVKPGARSLKVSL
jgi:hypothetical protein